MKSIFTKTLSLIIFWIICNQNVLAQNTAPVVTNVDFNMRNDGSKMVDITYDVNDVDGQTMTVTIAASSDGGATWNLPITQVIGAVGSGITNGTGKTIVWNAGAEIPNFYSETVQIRITADDGYVFTCGTSTVYYSGKTYNTVQIGNQCWIKENLDVGTMIQTSQGQSNNGVIEKYCYNNNTANCSTLGGLYNWNEAMQYINTPGVQGICPQSWHIPTYAEFQALRSNVANNGNALKAVGQGIGPGVGTNSSGFSALLAGYSTGNGYFDDLGRAGYFWSSTEFNTLFSYYMNLYLSDSNIALSILYFKGYGFNVRCVKDPHEISLITPTGEENWQDGTIKNITWTSINVSNIKLEYTTNNGINWTTITESTPASIGSYNWTIPNTPSLDCKVRVSDVNNPQIIDTSDNSFTISSIYLISPNGGENWQVGTSQNITWTSSSISNIKIEYTTNNGYGWISIISSTPAANGSYNWTVPNTPTNNAKIRILDATNSTIGDSSEFLFAFVPVPVDPCPGIPTVTYADKTYNTVQIGNQCWIKENLDVGTMVQGNQNPTDNGIIEKYCFGDNENNCITRGGLYQWDEAMQYITSPGARGICPEGWHIPTLAELQVLANYVGNDGNALKVVGYGGSTNSSGFTALLAGYRSTGGISVVMETMHIFGVLLKVIQQIQI